MNLDTCVICLCRHFNLIRPLHIRISRVNTNKTWKQDFKYILNNEEQNVYIDDIRVYICYRFIH